MVRRWPYALFVVYLGHLCQCAHGSYFEGEIWEKDAGPTAFVPLPETTPLDLIHRIKTQQTLGDLQAYLSRELLIKGPRDLAGRSAVPAGWENEAWEDMDFLRLIFNHYLYENGHYTYEVYETWPAIICYATKKWGLPTTA